MSANVRDCVGRPREGLGGRDEALQGEGLDKLAKGIG